MWSNAVKWSGLILAAAAVGAVSAAKAQPGDAVVRERRQDMKAIAVAAKGINAMFKGTSPYDAKTFKAAAETIRTYSGEKLSVVFEGSVTAEGSKAKANIEVERTIFDKLAAELGVRCGIVGCSA